MNTYLPFTYVLRFKPTGQLYYGSRYGKDANPATLWSTYFTSSGKIEELISLHGKDAFEYEIRKTFETAEQAIAWEHRVLVRCGVPKNKQFLNGHPGGTKFARTGPHSDGTRAKIKRGWSDERRAKAALAREKYWTPERRAAASEASKGKTNKGRPGPRSEETRAKMREAALRRWAN